MALEILERRLTGITQLQTSLWDIFVEGCFWIHSLRLELFPRFPLGRVHSTLLYCITAPGSSPVIPSCI
jgi:hypothetical protein